MDAVSQVFSVSLMGETRPFDFYHRRCNVGELHRGHQTVNELGHQIFH
jgi:hypothetical protein